MWRKIGWDFPVLYHPIRCSILPPNLSRSIYCVWPLCAVANLSTRSAHLAHSAVNFIEDSVPNEELLAHRKFTTKAQRGCTTREHDLQPLKLNFFSHPFFGLPHNVLARMCTIIASVGGFIQWYFRVSVRGPECRSYIDLHAR